VREKRRTRSGTRQNGTRIQAVAHLALKLLGKVSFSGLVGSGLDDFFGRIAVRRELHFLQRHQERE
jgi:hypothetical protein